MMALSRFTETHAMASQSHVTVFAVAWPTDDDEDRVWLPIPHIGGDFITDRISAAAPAETRVAA